MKITFGYTPDTDDAFHYYALEAGKIRSTLPDTEFHFRHLHIQTLNELALKAELEISAISSIFYPQIEKQYVVLSAGSSVGRGYGPVLVGRQKQIPRDLRGKTVAVPGQFTTGFFLLNYFYEGFRPVFMNFDQVAPAVEKGEADAGVLIHEELLNYQLRGLEKISCLGKRWFEESGLPLPVGLTVARRDLGEATIQCLRGLLEQSLRYALENPQEAMAFAATFASGKGEVTEEFVAKFANEDTECMPADVREGLRILYQRAHRRGLIPNEPKLEIV